MGMLPDAHTIGNLTIFFLPPPQSVTIIAVVCAPLVSTANPDHVNVRVDILHFCLVHARLSGHIYIFYIYMCYRLLLL